MPHLGRHRAVAIALTTALLQLAPVRLALQLGCDRCPPDCPMHLSAHARPASDHTDAPVPRCHGSRQAPHADDSGNGPRVARPSCGSHATLLGFDLSPILPAAAPPWGLAPAIARAAEAPSAAIDRRADPPDPPPPLACT